MASIIKTVDVNVPVRTAYNQWTQFESFPQFMEGVEQVQQLDDRRLRWHANIAGKDEVWDAIITEQQPDMRVAWTSTSGAKNAGVVSFHRLDDSLTRVTLQLDYEPEGVIENLGNLLGVVERRVEGDMKRFKEFIEARGHETGAWRGKVEQEKTR